MKQAIDSNGWTGRPSRSSLRLKWVRGSACATYGRGLRVRIKDAIEGFMYGPHAPQPILHIHDPLPTRTLVYRADMPLYGTERGVEHHQGFNEYFENLHGGRAIREMAQYLSDVVRMDRRYSEDGERLQHLWSIECVEPSKRKPML